MEEEAVVVAEVEVGEEVELVSKVTAEMQPVERPLLTGHVTVASEKLGADLTFQSEPRIKR